MVMLDAQKKEARLGRNRDLDLVRHGQPTASLPRFLRDQNAQVIPYFPLLIIGQQRIDPDIALQMPEPFIREGPGQQFRPAAFLNPGEHPSHPEGNHLRQHDCGHGPYPASEGKLDRLGVRRPRYLENQNQDATQNQSDNPELIQVEPGAAQEAEAQFFVNQ